MLGGNGDLVGGRRTARTADRVGRRVQRLVQNYPAKIPIARCSTATDRRTPRKRSRCRRGRSPLPGTFDLKEAHLLRDHPR